ncbi:hypothetical protein E4T39_08227 [Aureobasidium subglaciale]|nr:hypothetical protein E4T39_08227 [Aureobasidium subglaciale]
MHSDLVSILTTWEVLGLLHRQKALCLVADTSKDDHLKDNRDTDYCTTVWRSDRLTDLPPGLEVRTQLQEQNGVHIQRRALYRTANNKQLRDYAVRTLVHPYAPSMGYTKKAGAIGAKNRYVIVLWTTDDGNVATPLYTLKKRTRVRLAQMSISVHRKVCLASRMTQYRVVLFVYMCRWMFEVRNVSEMDFKGSPLGLSQPRCTLQPRTALKCFFLYIKLQTAVTASQIPPRSFPPTKNALRTRSRALDSHKTHNDLISRR